jgi:Raf kinase inhibitor-like YbhB/YbcL family protein
MDSKLSSESAGNGGGIDIGFEGSGAGQLSGVLSRGLCAGDSVSGLCPRRETSTVTQAPNRWDRNPPSRWVLVFVALLATAACGDDAPSLRPAGSDQTQSILDPTTTTAPLGFSLTGPWADGAAIDPRFSCRGAGVSPALSWTGVPESAKELALVVIDPDASGFVHWILTGLDPIITSLEEGRAPEGSEQWPNGTGDKLWTGPCPPSGVHRYEFVLHALSAPLDVALGSDSSTVVAAINPVTIETATYTGTFAAAS